MRWPWTKAPSPRAVHRSSQQLLIESLNDQITYLRHQLHISRAHEDEVRRQNVILVDQRAAWNAASLEERVVDRHQTRPAPAQEREVRSYETEGGAFQNHLGGGDHLELEDDGERRHKHTFLVPDAETDIEKAMLAREQNEVAVAVGAGNVTFPRG